MIKVLKLELRPVLFSHIMLALKLSPDTCGMMRVYCALKI
jgi:hypothetical protein